MEIRRALPQIPLHQFPGIDRANQSPALWVRFKSYRTCSEFESTYQLGSGNANAEAALRDAYRKGVEIIRCAVSA